jgi:hypothetical protein
VADAGARGARVVMAGEFPSAEGTPQRRMPLRLVIGAPADSEIARHEIFGAAMLVNPYREIADAVAAINAGDRPLALYYFGTDEAEQAWVLDHTLSGGVAINDVLMHAALHDAPFGGVGASGMGHYHGREGFLEFSHMRSVYRAGATTRAVSGACCHRTGRTSRRCCAQRSRREALLWPTSRDGSCSFLAPSADCVARPGCCTGDGRTLSRSGGSLSGSSAANSSRR